MILQDPNIESYKRMLVLQYVLPAISEFVAADTRKTEEIVKRCRLLSAVKYQTLEVPGPSSEGFLWFPINAMCHSYYYNEEMNRKCGTRIFHKRMFVFNDSSLLDGLPRTDYIEVLEQGDMLSIRYCDMIDLIEMYEDINVAIKSIPRQEAYYRRHNTLLNLSPFERVRRFRNENKSFIHCTSQEVQAMHVNLTRNGYANQLKKLERVVMNVV